MSETLEIKSIKARVLPWLSQQQQELIEAADKFISEDAPKSRFSINTGKRIMIQEFKDFVEGLERDPDFKRGTDS